MRRCRLPLSLLALGALAIGVVGWSLIDPLAVLAKEFELTGTVDCGVRSGRTCSIGDTLAVWTRDLSGNLERVEIDVTWIQKRLREQGIDQDDLVCLEVKEKPGGGYQAVALSDNHCGKSGSFNPGANRAEQSHEADNEDDTAQVFDTPGSLDLTIIKSDSPDPAQFGGILDPRCDIFATCTIYTITVKNEGSVASGASVVVRDVLNGVPEEYGIVFSPSPGGGFSCTADASPEEEFDGLLFVIPSGPTLVLTCTRGSLRPGETVTLTFAGVADPFLEQTVTDTATVDPNNAIAESNEGNNADTETTLFPEIIDGDSGARGARHVDSSPWPHSR